MYEKESCEFYAWELDLKDRDRVEKAVYFPLTDNDKALLGSVSLDMFDW